MARQVIITPQGGAAVTMTPTKKPIEISYENDDRGGSDDLPNVRAGVAKKIKFEVAILDATIDDAAVLALITAQDSEGDSTVAATDFLAVVHNLADAIVDVSIEGDGAQTAVIECIGTHST
jgi:hypothetical protein